MRRVILAAWFCGLVFAAGVALAGVALAGVALAGVALAAEPTGDSTPLVNDVVVQPSGVLRGRVFGRSADPSSSAGLRVTLIGPRQTRAVTSTGSLGEFAFRNVPWGVYQVVVEGLSQQRPGQQSWCCYRVWTARTAPPRAAGEMLVQLDDRIVRGRIVRGQLPNAFPIMSLPQAATVLGIAVGVVATPVIYHNTLLDNRVPVSP